MSTPPEDDAGPGGVGVVPIWMIHDESITPQAKIVYLVLSSHWDGGPTKDLYVDQLVSQSGLKSDFARLALDELAEIGMVDYMVTAGPNEHPAPAIAYTLYLHRRADG